MSTEEVRVELYRSLIERGRAPSREELATSLGLDPSVVSDSLRALHDEDVIAFAPGTEDVWLVHPFCATDAPFTVTSGTRRWDAICIWDALGILALLAIDGEVVTKCPDCSEHLSVAVVDGVVQGTRDAIVHFGVPANRWYEDIAHT